MRGRPAPRAVADALPRPAGDGRRLRLVQGRGLRGRRKAGVRGVLRLRAPRDGAAPPVPEVPPHRIRAGQARRGRRNVSRRAGALPSRLRPVAAQPDGAPRRRGIRLRRRLHRLQPGVPHPVPLVPLHPPRRRHDAARREDRRHRPAGTDRRQVGLLPAALGAARLAYARNGPGPHGRRGAAQARPKAALHHRRSGPVRRGTPCGPDGGGRPDMESAEGRRRDRPALRPRPGGAGRTGFRRSRNRSAPTCPPTSPSRVRGGTSPTTCCRSFSSP